MELIFYRGRLTINKHINRWEALLHSDQYYKEKKIGHGIIVERGAVEFQWLMRKSQRVWTVHGQRSSQVQRAGGRNEPDIFKEQTGVQGDCPRKGQFEVRSERLAGSDCGTCKTSHSKVLNWISYNHGPKCVAQPMATKYRLDHWRRLPLWGRIYYEPWMENKGYALCLESPSINEGMEAL